MLELISDKLMTKKFNFNTKVKKVPSKKTESFYFYIYCIF